MKETYAKSLAVILKFEGGKVNDPDDPGGKTNQGVTQRTYNAFREKINQSPRDVYAMTETERDAIYKTQYWDKCQGDDLPEGIDVAVFDGSVNSGVSQSVKWLQGALGKLYNGKIDGLIGAKTIAAVKSANDHDALIADMEERRMEFLKSLKGWAKYQNGWMSRVRQITDVAQAWASGRSAPTVVEAADTHVKANLDDAKPLPYKAWIDSIIGGGAAIAAAATALQTQIDAIQGQLGPFMNTPLGASVPWLSSINHWLAIGALVASAVAGVYRFYITNYDAKLRAALDLDSGMQKPEERAP